MEDKSTLISEKVETREQENSEYESRYKNYWYDLVLEIIFVWVTCCWLISR